MSLNDNEKAPEHIKELLGKDVTVYSPVDSSHWRGRLAAYHERPVITLSGGTHGGVFSSGNTILPADYRIEELPPPPPPESCPHCGQMKLNLYDSILY